jgi:hypothetical protein
MEYSELSMRGSIPSAPKVLFKVTFNDEWKRISFNRDVLYSELMNKCKKSFNLEEDPISQYIFIHEEGEIVPRYIDSQFQLMRFLRSYLT